jgi:hypothetical protein
MPAVMERDAGDPVPEERVLELAGLHRGGAGLRCHLCIAR